MWEEFVIKVSKKPGFCVVASWNKHFLFNNLKTIYSNLKSIVSSKI